MTIDKLTPEERERPTLKTISRLTGFSIPTVSRALSDAPDIRKQTKKTVQDVADKLGYRRDRAAVRLRTGKTNVIALVLSTEHELMNLTAKLIGSIAGSFRNTPYHMIIIPYFPDEDPMVPVEYIVKTGSADGMILNRILPDDPRVTYMQDQNFPFAMHGRTNNSDNIPFCDFDNDAFGAMAIETLATKSRTEFLLVAPPQEQNYSKLMIAGARRASEKLGGRLHVLEGATSDDPSPVTSAAVERALKEHPGINGIVTPSSSSSMATTLAVERLGLRLGKELDIASKEAVPFLKAFRSEIMVTHEDIGLTGRFLAEALVEAIEKPSRPPLQKLLLPGAFE